MYKMYLDGVLLPVTPASLKVKISNKNTTVTLINDGEINILKTAGLTELSFTALLPQVQHPFAVYPDGFQNAGFYMQKLERLKTGKKPFQFVFTRTLPDGTPLFDTDIKVSLEDYTLTEDAKNGLDVNVKVKLKQYREYATKKLTVNNSSGQNSGHSGSSTSKIKVGDMVKIKSTATTYYRGQTIPAWVKKGTYKVYQVGTKGKPDYIVVDKTGINSPFRESDLYIVSSQTATSETQRSTSGKTTAATYTVKSGDTLWSIAKTQLGSSSKWKDIYSKNKSVIEQAAKKHGKKSSSMGHWIYPGTELKLK